MSSKILVNVISSSVVKSRLKRTTRAMRRAGAEEVYKEANRTVHVISGDLKKSGRVVERNKVASVIYDTPYAIYEERLHPFLSRALRKKTKILKAMSLAGRNASR